MTRLASAAAPVALASAVLAGGGACAQRQDLYDWAGYEESLYLQWCRPDAFQVQERLQLTEAAIFRNRAEGRRPPPGVQAHAGYLNLEAGNHDAAMQWFAAERDTYPESAVFMGRLLGEVLP